MHALYFCRIDIVSWPCLKAPLKPTFSGVLVHISTLRASKFTNISDYRVEICQTRNLVCETLFYESETMHVVTVCKFGTSLDLKYNLFSQNIVHRKIFLPGVLENFHWKSGLNIPMKNIPMKNVVLVSPMVNLRTRAWIIILRRRVWLFNHEYEDLFSPNIFRRIFMLFFYSP